MRGILRRQVLVCLTALAGFLIGLPRVRVSEGQEEQHSVWDKPQIKRSEAKAIIREEVEQISQSTKENFGYDLTEQKKDELVEMFLREFENHTKNSYSFMDP